MVDEAAVSAIAGELTPYAAGGIYCFTIGACRTVADYRRAGEWTEAAMRWCERQSVSGFPGVCGVHRAEILRLRGAFADAETEARGAVESLMTFGMLRSAAWGHFGSPEVAAGQPQCLVRWRARALGPRSTSRESTPYRQEGEPRGRS